MSDDYYRDLGVDPDADEETIKAAHRAAVKRTHPDNGESGDREAFERVQHAWVVLSDPEKRAKHDRGEKIDGDPENRLRDIVDRIILTFKAVMTSSSVEHDDLIVATKERLAVGAKEIRSRIDAKRVEIHHTECVLERVACQTGHNFIAHALEERISDLKAEIKRGEHDLDLQVEAHARCDAFTYRTDPQQDDTRGVWTDNVRPPSRERLITVLGAALINAGGVR